MLIAHKGTGTSIDQRLNLNAATFLAATGRKKEGKRKERGLLYPSRMCICGEISAIFGAREMRNACYLKESAVAIRRRLAFRDGDG